MLNLLRMKDVATGITVYVRNHGFRNTGYEAVIEKVNAKSVVVDGKRFTAKNNGAYYRCEATDQILYLV